MKHNLEAVAALTPDYVGFIFYEESPRNFKGVIPEITPKIKRVGVFVDASLTFILEKSYQYKLDVIQLHGEESPTFCQELKQLLDNRLNTTIPIVLWKVFSIKDTFDFSNLTPYEEVVDKFLFDTKGREKGGNGYTFDWRVLQGYSSKKAFILSGGIGMEALPELSKLLQTGLPIYAIDVNSKFEITPGKKDIKLLQKFSQQLNKALEQ